MFYLEFWLPFGNMVLGAGSSDIAYTVCVLRVAAHLTRNGLMAFIPAVLDLCPSAISRLPVCVGDSLKVRRHQQRVYMEYVNINLLLFSPIT